MRLYADLLDRLLDGGSPLGLAQRARFDGEDDVGGVTRRGGEALVEHIQRRLRFRAWGREVIDELAAAGAGRHAEGHEHHRHDRE